MTKIVFITDIHGKYGSLSRIFEKESPDYVLIGGDLTNFGPIEGVSELLNQIKAPTFIVPGNCDPKELEQEIKRSKSTWLHKNSVDIDQITVTGLGGSNITPFNTLFELSEDEISGILSSATTTKTKNRWNILVTHAPPYGVLDNVGSTDNPVHVGSQSIARFIDNFDIICCGHIHEQKGIQRFNNKLCVNPGPASEGNYARILLNETPDIKLMNVNT
ncbi:MAG TPA: metallophosphoesterase [Methanocorpusculum sp.]|nr:metallophosphoesterase [Methanocorpusculum sp.]